MLAQRVAIRKASRVSTYRKGTLLGARDALGCPAEELGSLRLPHVRLRSYWAVTRYLHSPSHVVGPCGSLRVHRSLHSWIIALSQSVSRSLQPPLLGPVSSYRTVGPVYRHSCCGRDSHGRTFGARCSHSVPRTESRSSSQSLTIGGAKSKGPRVLKCQGPPVVAGALLAEVATKVQNGRSVFLTIPASSRKKQTLAYPGRC